MDIGARGFSDATVERAPSLRGLSVGETAARHSSLSKPSIVFYQTSKPIGKHVCLTAEWRECGGDRYPPQISHWRNQPERLGAEKPFCPNTAFVVIPPLWDKPFCVRSDNKLFSFYISQSYSIPQSLIFWYFAEYYRRISDSWYIINLSFASSAILGEFREVIFTGQ